MSIIAKDQIRRDDNFWNGAHCLCETLSKHQAPCASGAFNPQPGDLHTLLIPRTVDVHLGIGNSAGASACRSVDVHLGIDDSASEFLLLETGNTVLRSGLSLLSPTPNLKELLHSLDLA